MSAEKSHPWRGLLATAMLAAVLVPASAESTSGGETIEVMIIGDTIPDPSFYSYDPSISYRIVPYPSWAEIWDREDTARWLEMQEAARALVPADFIVELPYGRFGNQAINSRIRSTCEASIQSRGASVLLPVPATPLLAHLAPDETRVDLGQLSYATRIGQQNRDVLGGNLNTQFSVKASSPPLTDLSGLIDSYHDANLFVMKPDPMARTVAVIHPWGGLLDRMGPGKPWLLRMNLSYTPRGARLGATGYVWKCASPLTGVFFFPQGGLVASRVVPGAGYVHVATLKLGEHHEYAWDIISHIILYSRGREIPEVVVAHRVRTKFAQYYRDYSEAYRALDFAEAYCSTGKTYRIWLELAEVGSRRRQAAVLYRSGRIEDSDKVMQDALRAIRSAKREAERALRQSLFATRMAMYGLTLGTLLVSVYITLSLVCRPRMKAVSTTGYLAVDRVYRRHVSRKRRSR